MSTKLVKIASIHIAERHRRDLGDIDGLAASIRLLGLLEPIVVDLVCESSLRFVSRLIANVRYRRFCVCQFGNALPFRIMTEFARPGWLGEGLLSTLLTFEWARELLLDDDGDEGHGG